MVASHQDWPQWWSWPLDCANPHLAKRMVDRSSSETDLREMLQAARNYRPHLILGRWIIETTHAGNPWEVVVEPDESLRSLIVVPAYQA